MIRACVRKKFLKTAYGGAYGVVTVFSSERQQQLPDDMGETDRELLKTAIRLAPRTEQCPHDP